MGGGEQVGGGWEALDEGAGGRELPVLLRGTVSCQPALCDHVTLEALDTVAHAGVEPARPRQTSLCDHRGWESSKGGDAEELWWMKIKGRVRSGYIHKSLSQSTTI